MKGDADAHVELVRRFERPVLSLIVRMVRDPATAEDLAQETFVKAFRRLESFDRQRRFASWLFKIAHNTTLDHLRRRQLPTVPLEPANDSGEKAWEAAASAVDEPGRRLESAELLAGLERAIGRLQPRYREILLLRFREGLAYKEIAEVIDLPMGTVKIQLHRARHALAQELLRLGFEPTGAPGKGTAKHAGSPARRDSARETE